MFYSVLLQVFQIGFQCANEFKRQFLFGLKLVKLTQYMYLSIFKKIAKILMLIHSCNIMLIFKSEVIQTRYKNSCSKKVKTS